MFLVFFFIVLSVVVGIGCGMIVGALGGIIIGGSDSPGVISGTGIDLIKNAIPIKDLSVLQNGNDIEITGQINHPYKCCN